MAGDPERSAHAHAATPVIGPVNAFPRRQARDMAGLIRRDTVPIRTAHRSTDSCYPSSSARRSPSRAPRAQPGRTSPWARLPQSRVLSNDTCSISSVTGTKPGAGWACAAADARENGSRRQGAPDEAGNRTVDRRPCSHHDNPFARLAANRRGAIVGSLRPGRLSIHDLDDHRSRRPRHARQSMGFGIHGADLLERLPFRAAHRVQALCAGNDPDRIAAADPSVAVG